MNEQYTIDEWKIIEDKFDPEFHKGSESIFSLGNGRMGQRANFEEDYLGDSLQGTYIAGVYYPDKTRVGWWKNGYPEYFAKVLNAPDFTGIHVFIDGELLDLSKWKTVAFKRVLDMKQGILSRSFTAENTNGNKVTVEAERFISMVDKDVAAIRYHVVPLNFSGEVIISPYLNGHVKNEDSNYDEIFWNILHTENKRDAILLAQTKKLDFQVCYAMQNQVFINGQLLTSSPDLQQNDEKVQSTYNRFVSKGEKLTLEKYVGVCSSLNYGKKVLVENAVLQARNALNKGYDTLKTEHVKYWENKWNDCDIVISGDAAAQQAIRFNIFQLNQTYTGDDPRLNVGPKGFTGEKYGGTTYWDTEAYCVPFFLGTAPSEITRNLLIYRNKHLGKAIENAQKLGFKDGAALYPMVTINGEECHNEWEITFEEIHRNGAIAYAIYDYVKYTGDVAYLAEYGLEVLIGIARFWAQRVNYSDNRKKYVMLGVTGPNEYENNVNNNWYTNYISTWCLKYANEVYHNIEKSNSHRLNEIVTKTNFKKEELGNWEKIATNMYFPEDKELGIFLQQDGYLDKEQIHANDIPTHERPINQHWSWDRILRSVFIKQADVLQGMFFFEQDFSKEQLEKNFDFYEPRTVHESSLSPCVHSILANSIGRIDKAYELFLRTSRLDLDDYNHEVDEGLHITSMAGTWMAIIQGFGGVRIRNGMLSFAPKLPDGWKWFSFKLNFRNRIVKVEVSNDRILVSIEKGKSLTILLYGSEIVI